MIEKILLNQEWLFLEKEYSEENLSSPAGEYKEISLPHDYLIYDVKRLYRDSIGWYKKIISYVPDGLEWIIRFEGIYMNSEIFVNGKAIGSWKYGYSTFELELTPYLIEGENEILVRVVHQSPNSRWYSGAGIYRNVHLIKRASTHIPSYSLYITPARCADSDTWNIDIDVEICADNTPFDTIRYIISEKNGKNLIADMVSVDYDSLKPNDTSVKDDGDGINKSVTLKHSMQLDNPKLWDIYQGNLYELRAELLYNGEVFDFEKAVFGFRTIRIDPNEGFFLNDRHIKIKGSCEHHGFGCLGAAVNKSAVRRKLTLLKNMGVNAIRTAHNMPSLEFMELADEMGFLVDSEAFDMWGHTKTTYDYGRFFAENAAKDVASWILRDRNHPSIIMWSVGNEIYDMHAGSEGYEELEMLVGEVKKHDYRKHAFITFASNYMRWENTQKCAGLVDAVGYNYGEYLYNEHHQKHPDWVIYGSETASMLGSRNVYHFPIETSILCDTNEQCSSLGNCFAGWGAHKYTDNIIADRDASFSLGQFIWAGVDYFGEPTPYHTRNSYFGQIDTAGFPKDSYYIYQSEWTDYKDNPVIHIFPYWDFNPGQLVDICICSNTPTVELFVNGKSMGRKEIDHIRGTELVPGWKTTYEPGMIEAVGYDENGNELVRECRHSFSDAASLVLTADRCEMKGNYDELIFVEISAVDKDGNPVENANNRVTINVTGAGRLVGIDNGDSTDFDEVKGTSKRLFQGRLLAVVAPNAGETGNAVLTVSSPGLPEASITLYVFDKGNAYSTERNKYATCVAGGIGGAPLSSPKEEIPVRKVELHHEGSLELTAKRRSIDIHWKICPSNATYNDMSWRITDDTGIDINTATITMHEGYLTVYAAGDGSFQLRCDVNNGGTVSSVQSCLTLTASNIGPVHVNPYEPVIAGLCTNRPMGLSEGVNHGVRFLGKEKTRILYSEMDFGKNGSEEIEMYIFKYYPGPVHFGIYLDDSVSLLEGEFNEAAGWLEFKKAVYRLNERICGVHRISIESQDNFQLNRFMFVPVLHGFDTIYAADYDEIFGDNYTVNSKTITHIGNNVTIKYHKLNMGSRTAARVRIYGRTLNQKDSIQLKIDSNGAEHTELIEFGQSTDYVEREYDITPVTGDISVTLLFLPGCNFELEWFRFISTK